MHRQGGLEGGRFYAPKALQDTVFQGDAIKARDHVVLGYLLDRKAEGFDVGLEGAVDVVVDEIDKVVVC